MKNASIIDKWLNSAPSEESVDKVKRVLFDYFGKDAVTSKSSGSHQLRVKHPALKHLPGFGDYGHLSIPVSGGQTVKGYYLKRIAQAIKQLEEAEES